MRGFNLGGVVDNFNRSMAIPRFAGGGLAAVPAASPQSKGGAVLVKLDFGLGPDDVFDMVTDTFTASRFQQFALSEARTSAGRRPGRK
ncbi:hypothetical protein EOD23_11565 [Mesorhizobium sp. USDA-HM6]|nr:hypothetical protein EOD23_11565 [Mesorhizobium sp. USDA-HM6]